MRVATFNVNSINARLSFVLGWLADRKPDIVCLQELKLTAEEFPYGAFEAAGYHACVHGQKSWNGVAILSREPLELVQQGLPGAEENGARLITARTSGLLVTSVYVPNGKTLAHADFAMKLEWLATLGHYLRTSHDPSEPVVIGGDFNLCPSDLDSHAPDRLRGSIFHTDDERRLFAAILEQGYEDLYRALEPEGRMFSWWDYRAGCFHKNLGLRIDFLLGSKPVRARTRSCWTDRDYRKKKDGQTPSDHAPVIADLD